MNRDTAASRPATVPTEAYTGVDNLEVMQEAVNYNNWLCDLVTQRAPKGTALVDFGAGAGTFAAALRDRGYTVSCVEPDDLLQRRLKDNGFETVSFLDSVADGSYEFIYTFNVLEHIEDDAAIAKELARVLKRGGTLLIYVPAFQVLYSSMDAKVGHHRRYRLDRLVRIARAAGLEIREAKYADSLGFLASLAYKAIGSKDGDLSRGSIRIYDRYAFPVSRCLDLVSNRLFGKNALLVARKP